MFERLPLARIHLAIPVSFNIFRASMIEGSLASETGGIALPRTVGSLLRGDSVLVIRDGGNTPCPCPTPDLTIVNEVVTTGRNRLTRGARATIDNTVTPATVAVEEPSAINAARAMATSASHAGIKATVKVRPPGARSLRRSSPAASARPASCS